VPREIQGEPSAKSENLAERNETDQGSDLAERSQTPRDQCGVGRTKPTELRNEPDSRSAPYWWPRGLTASVDGSGAALGVTPPEVCGGAGNWPHGLGRARFFFQKLGRARSFCPENSAVLAIDERTR
jgi:hypothetical protein